MEISEKENSTAKETEPAGYFSEKWPVGPPGKYGATNNEMLLVDLIPEKLDLDRGIYRKNILQSHRYAWQASYRHTELLISADSDIKEKIKGLLEEIYRQLDYCIQKEPAFLKSLSPVKVKPFFPEAIRNMCRLSALFNVGPMAAVAGAVNDFLAAGLKSSCNELIIENGGDLYIKSGRDINTGVYVKNSFFKDLITVQVDSADMPCGICSSSGTFGHSLSLGNCDLAVVLSDSSTGADAAATAVANSINTVEDIRKSIDFFKGLSPVKGLLIIKKDIVGIWGKIRLV